MTTTSSSPKGAASEIDSATQALAPVAPGRYRDLFRNRRFLALWLGQILSQLGDRIVFVVFVALLARNFGDSERLTSYLYMAFTIPAVLLTAIAGVFVDRWPRRPLLVGSNLIRGALIILMPVALHTGLMSVYWLAFGLSAVTQFFIPAEAATIPFIVETSQLMVANSLFTTTMMASVIFGFALGDPLISLLGFEQVHWGIAAFFLLAGLVLVGVRVRTTDWKSQTAVREGWWEQTTDALTEFFGEMREGLVYIRYDRMILAAMLKLAVLFSAIVALCILCISYAREFLYDGNAVVAAQKFAYIIALSGIGMAIGAVLVGRFWQGLRRSRLVYGGFLLMGTMLLCMGEIGRLPESWTIALTDDVVLGGRFVVTYVLAALAGFGAALVAIPLQALLHELIPEAMRGKIMGIQFTLLSTASTLPVLVAGLLVARVGVVPMFLAIGGSLLLVGFGGLASTTSGWLYGRHHHEQEKRPIHW